MAGNTNSNMNSISNRNIAAELTGASRGNNRADHPLGLDPSDLFNSLSLGNLGIGGGDFSDSAMKIQDDDEEKVNGLIN